MEKQKNIESNIVFLQCPNISLCSCQDFPGECVECGGDPDPISSISPLTLLTYFTTIPTLHTKHVSSGLVKKSVVFISNQPNVTLSNDKSLLQARQARQDQGRQRCPAGIAQVSSDAFSEFVRSSAAIVRLWAIGRWISQQLSFLCRNLLCI